mgnify:CR=1 FL=1|tara:strand:+ start:3000 stop:3920 length:921 start_codon:yes stop_codon:yes gene_type:complete
MKVVHLEGGEYPDCIVKHLGFDKFSEPSDADSVLFWGWNSAFNEDLKREYRNYKKKFFLDTASPTAFYSGPDIVETFKYFDGVYTICPYTSDILSNNGIKGTAVCFPVPEECLDVQEEKVYDAIYYGQIHSPKYSVLLNALSNFNYRFCSIANGAFSELITDFGVTTQEKWKLLAKSRCSVGLNLVFPKAGHLQHADQYKKYVSKGGSEALFSSEVPQMKTRMVEAAACGTLMLLYRDGYNVVENWFTSDKHFLYFSNQEELHARIQDIRDNYDKYLPIVKAAKDQVKQYTSRNLFNKMKWDSKHG